MRRHFRLCSLAGVDIRLHWTFLLMPVLFWFALGARGLFLVGFVFTCVTLHELCHSLQARRFGIEVTHIVLYPIGGVAQLRSFGTRPHEEFLTSVVGPLFNFVLAAVLFVPMYAWLGPAVLLDRQTMFRVSADTWPRTFASCFWINPLLGLFNLIPAFPMDGGRMLRSLLATWLGLLRATRIAIMVGRVIMVGFVAVGILSNPWLLIIAVFLYVAGEREVAQVELLALLTRARMAEQS